MPPTLVAATEQASLRHVAACCRFYHDRAGHVRMNVAEVLVGAGRGERERKTVVGIERLRSLEGVVGDGDPVRDVVLVGPGHRGAGFYRHRLRIEGEIVDADGRRRSRWSLRPGEQHTASQYRPDRGADERRADCTSQHDLVL